jgi:TDG/mug DNA glycosylase family protein
MVLPDVLKHGLDVVFCGTAVGATSARQGAYYAGRGNGFWSTLHLVGFTPIQLRPKDYGQVVLFRIGLTDLVKHVAGNDVVLSKGHFDRERLRASIQEYRPRILAFTSKRAAQEFIGHPVCYGQLPETIGKTILFVLPSPSGSARRYWSIEPWRELSQLRARENRELPVNTD